MKKSDWQYLVDTLLFICIVGIAFIGLLMGLVLPEGPTADESAKYFLGLHRHQWGDVHFYLSLAFTALIIIHLILSWKWIKSKAKQLFKGNWVTMLTLTVAVSFLAVFLIWVTLPKYSEKYEDFGKGRGREASLIPGYAYAQEKDQETIVITGQMTLQDVASTTGLPAERIIQSLGLTKKVSLKQSLGLLRKKHGFSMEEVRNAVASLLESDTVVKAPAPQEKVPETAPEQREVVEEIIITGQTTFREVEKKTGIPASVIIQALGLPENIPEDQTLGRLKQKYSFSMEKVREIAALHLKKSSSPLRVILEQDETPEGQEKITIGRGEVGSSGLLVTGQMSLLEIENATGISARTIADKIGLPQGVSLTERLGRLRKMYNFSMQQLRDVVAALIKKKRD